MRVGGFGRNLRKEVTKSAKYYFYDNGVRNSIIEDFKPFQARADSGSLWENFLVMERIKRNAYSKTSAAYYFWRTYDQQEIDLVEERGGELSGYEMKLGPKKSAAPRAWLTAYPNATYEVINKENYLDFVL